MRSLKSEQHSEDAILLYLLVLPISPRTSVYYRRGDYNAKSYTATAAVLRHFPTNSRRKQLRKLPKTTKNTSSREFLLRWGRRNLRSFVPTHGTLKCRMQLQDLTIYVNDPPRRQKRRHVATWLGAPTIICRFYAHSVVRSRRWWRDALAPL